MALQRIRHDSETELMKEIKDKRLKTDQDISFVLGLEESLL